MAGTTNLKEAKRSALVEGYLSQMNLEQTQGQNGGLISGTIDIQTSEFNIVKVRVYVGEKTKAGAENRAWKGIQTVMTECKSIATHGKEEATLIKTSGCKVDPNAYYSTSGDLVENVQYSGNFFTRVKEDEFEPQAEFDVEMYIENIRELFDADGASTGKVLVTGWAPTYNTIGKIQLLAEDEVGEAVLEGFSAGETVNFSGEIINKRIEVIREIPVKIGKPRVEKTVSYESAMLITGASEAYSDENGFVPYEAESIQLAIADRDAKLLEDKDKKSNKTQGSSASNNSVSKATPSANRPMPKF